MSYKDMLMEMVQKMRQADPERLARLEAMGADTSKVMLHGTSELKREPVFATRPPWTEFQQTHKPTFLSSDPNFVLDYSQPTSPGMIQQRTLPVFAPKGNYFDFENPEHIKELKWDIYANAPKAGLSDTNSQISALKALASQETKDNWLHLENLKEAIQRAGHPGYYEMERGVKNLAVFDPSNIKSVWAKGKGPGLIGGTAAAVLLGGSDEAEAGNKKALNDLIKKMRGRPVEEIEAELAKMYDLSYRGGHTAPIPSDSTAKITELDKIYPADIYGPNARQYYGDMAPYDWQSMSVLQSVRGRENAPVTMYRALPKQPSLFDELKNLQAQQAYILKYGKVPSNIETSLNKSQVFEKNYDRIDALKKELEANPEVIKRPEIIPGDWVTLSKDYAKQHAQSLENPTVIQKTVPARELYTDANSIHEQGWWPFKAALAAPMAALSTAQEVNPLNLLGSIVNKYRGAQQAVADKIVETVNPYPKQKPDQTTRELGRMIIDPINLIGGPVGDAVMALDLMTPNKEK